jgi:hypothetical protein
VAQLGARFHGMEEVDGSNPSRSTKTFQTVSAPFPTNNRPSGVQLESKLDTGPCGRAKMRPSQKTRFSFLGALSSSKNPTNPTFGM